MRNRLLTALAVLLLPLALLGQVPIASTPAVLGNDAGAWMFYENGDFEFVAVDEAGLTAKVISTSETGRDSTTLVTKWKDKNGLEHEVRTTYHGQKQGSRVAASERHAAAVALELASFPISRRVPLRLLGPSVLPLAA